MAWWRSGRSSIVAAAEPRALLERVFRGEAGRLIASLVRLLGDFDLAEELVSEAVVEALEHWPREGVVDDLQVRALICNNLATSRWYRPL